MTRPSKENLAVFGLCAAAGLLWVQGARQRVEPRGGRRTPQKFDFPRSEDQASTGQVPSGFTPAPPFPESAAAPRSSLSAREVRILDRASRTVIRLGSSADGEPGIWMTNAGQSAVIEAGVHLDGFPFLLVADGAKHSAALGGAEGINAAPALIFRARDLVRLSLGLSPSEPGEPAFVTRAGEDGKTNDLLNDPL